MSMGNGMIDVKRVAFVVFVSMEDRSTHVISVVAVIFVSMGNENIKVQIVISQPYVQIEWESTEFKM